MTFEHLRGKAGGETGSNGANGEVKAAGLSSQSDNLTESCCSNTSMPSISPNSSLLSEEKK